LAEFDDGFESKAAFTTLAASGASRALNFITVDQRPSRGADAAADKFLPAALSACQ
jgi:hypothetical protein